MKNPFRDPIAQGAFFFGGAALIAALVITPSPVLVTVLGMILLVIAIAALAFAFFA